MNNFIRRIKILGILLLVISCQQQGEKQDESIESKSEIKPDMHSGKISLDWDGTYFGVVPCADCEGIETLITLKKDNTCRIVTKYLGKSDEENVYAGSFEWDESGNKITLTVPEIGPLMFQVGEDKLFQLDIEGNRITGALAENYILERTDRVSLMDTKWKITELIGKPVEYKNPDAKEIFIQFLSDEKIIYGYSGCNTFRGKFEMKKGNLISFGSLATTLMACPEMEIEREFLSAIEKANNYNFDGRTLTLNRAKMAPIAKFEAISE